MSQLPPDGRVDDGVAYDDSPLIVIDGPFDTTPRPRRPNIPLPGQEPRIQPRRPEDMPPMAVTTDAAP